MVLPTLHPGHGKLTPLRVYSVRLDAHFELAFATAPLVTKINLAARNNSPDHYAKGTAVRHYILADVTALPPPVSQLVSGSISLP